MEYKAFLKTEYPRWVSFLATNGKRVPGVSPDVPVLIDFPQDAKNNLRKVILALKATDDQKNQLYIDIKVAASQLCLQKKMEKAAVIASVVTAAATSKMPLTAGQRNILQYTAMTSAIRSVAGR